MEDGSGKTWRPRTTRGSSWGRSRVREALARSVNNATIHLMRDVGVEHVIELARPHGIRAPLEPNLSLALARIRFSPDIATGVWVGFDSKEVLGKGETGGRAALPIWMDFMKVALERNPERDFEVPDDIVFARIDPHSGLLAPPGSPDGYFQAFLEGAEPLTPPPRPPSTPEWSSGGSSASTSRLGGSSASGGRVASRAMPERARARAPPIPLAGAGGAGRPAPRSRSPRGRGRLPRGFGQGRRPLSRALRDAHREVPRRGRRPVRGGPARRGRRAGPGRRRGRRPEILAKCDAASATALGFTSLAASRCETPTPAATSPRTTPSGSSPTTRPPSPRTPSPASGSWRSSSPGCVTRPSPSSASAACCATSRAGAATARGATGSSSAASSRPAPRSRGAAGPSSESSGWGAARRPTSASTTSSSRCSCAGATSPAHDPANDLGPAALGLPGGRPHAAPRGRLAARPGAPGGSRPVTVEVYYP